VISASTSTQTTLWMQPGIFIRELPPYFHPVGQNSLVNKLVNKTQNFPNYALRYTCLAFIDFIKRLQSPILLKKGYGSG